MRMRLYLLLLFSLIPFVLSTRKTCSTGTLETGNSCFPDYYWRDFRGKIPRDAIEGGRTASQRPFYVAQAYIKGREVSPAMVFHNKSEAVTIAAGGVTLKTSTNVKVLCSKHKDNLKWIPVKSEDLHKLVNTHFVVGGSEIGQVMYIGRAFDDTSTVIGKVYKHNHQYRGLWVPSQGGQTNYLSYEVLVYVCDNNDNDIKIVFD